MKTRTILARWTLGLLRGEDLPGMAGNLLLAGFDNQSLREVAGMSRPTLGDVGDGFERGMIDAGFRRMVESEAVRLLAFDIAEGIVSGEIAPLSGALQLAGLWSGSTGIEELVAFYGCTDDYEDHPEARSEIEDEIRNLARQFVAAHSELAA